MKHIKNEITYLSALLFTCSIFIFLIVFGQETKAAVKEGMTLCLDSIVPSLFPMLILSDFLSQIGSPDIFRKIRKKVYYYISGCNECTLESDLFGAFAGFPVGIRTACKLYELKVCTLETAQKAAICNISPGIAFSVFVVGESWFDNAAIGWSLLVSVNIANMFLRILLCLKDRRKKHETIGAINHQIRTPAADALIGSVRNSITGIAQMCGWILLFFAGTAPLNKLRLSSVIIGMLEVTKGVSAAAKKGKPLIAAFLLGFGGICIFLQLFPQLKALKIPLYQLIISRLFTAAISVCSEKLIIDLFFGCLPAISEKTGSVHTFRHSPAGFLTLAFFCLLFICTSANYDRYHKNNAERISLFRY